VGSGGFIAIFSLLSSLFSFTLLIALEWPNILQSGKNFGSFSNMTLYSLIFLVGNLIITDRASFLDASTLTKTLVKEILSLVTISLSEEMSLPIKKAILPKAFGFQQASGRPSKVTHTGMILMASSSKSKQWGIGFNIKATQIQSTVP